MSHPSLRAARNLLIGVALALILVTFPHALEDFYYGDLLRFGVTLSTGITLLVTTYTLQLVGIALAARENLRGALLLAIVGAIWCTGAVIVHGHDMLYAGPQYRHGLSSRLLELFIVMIGAAQAALSVRFAWMRGANKLA